MDLSHSHFLRNVSFRQLQVFDSITRTGSFTAAAGELFLTQPTVSAQMKKLEEGLGTELFEHVGRNIRLTEQGRALQELCSQIFHAVDNFEADLARRNSGQQGEISLAGGLTSEYFFPLLLGVFCRRYPGIKVALNITERTHILERIKRRQDDLWLISYPPQDPDLSSEALLVDQLVLVCHPQHRFADWKELSFMDLRQENFLMREEGAGSRLTLQQFLDQHHWSLRSQIALNSNEAIKQGVINGLGIALLSRYEIRQELQDGRLVQLPVMGMPLEETWYLTWHRRKPLSIAGDLFLQSALGEGRLILDTALKGVPN